ncbi:voltage gated chloride channel family protein [Burkholderia pseudomallei NCTC 13179]|nr:voltage gated chloride channel family protein [Burkholderia pseudomallei NCTC 13179]
MKRLHAFEPVAALAHLCRWLALSAVVGALAGSASALFLWALDLATGTRIAHPWLLWLLPAAGFATGWVYHRVGRSVERGNNLLIDEIHDPRAIVPTRMAPLVLVATVVTHLFGGSAGREGTAVQMGGALADRVTQLVGLDRDARRIMLMGGIAAGFSSVFGTPLAGAVFGLEVLAIGRLRYDALFACVAASIVADAVCRLWGSITPSTSCLSCPRRARRASRRRWRRASRSVSSAGCSPPPRTGSPRSRSAGSRIRRCGPSRAARSSRSRRRCCMRRSISASASRRSRPRFARRCPSTISRASSRSRSSRSRRASRAAK